MIEGARLEALWTPKLRAAGAEVYGILEPDLERMMRDVYAVLLPIEPKDVTSDQIERGLIKFQNILAGKFSEAYVETQRKTTFLLMEQGIDVVAYLVAYGYYQREGARLIAEHIAAAPPSTSPLFEAYFLALQCDTCVSIDNYFFEMERANANKLNDLNDASKQQIKRISTSISRFSKQTTILAINATIEAARAGDAGRGFSVVASEIKNVSSAIQSAATEIERLSEANE